MNVLILRLKKIGLTVSRGKIENNKKGQINVLTRSIMVDRDWRINKPID